jgi:hypothetical protein|tara:strand:- start:1947 stop:2132 length:186 start_codon:yes stop_codon:yes gene_type:complete
MLTMYLKRYNYYPVDNGGYVVMDDEFDIQLARCESLELVQNIVYALNEIDLQDPVDITKIH